MTDPTNDPDTVRDESGHALEGPYKHLRVLERRMIYLNKRIDRARQEGKILTHDQHESDALKWAIDTIYQWVELPACED